MDSYLCIAPDVKLGRDVKLSKFINLYGCEVGDETKIGAFVEIQKNAKIGRRCKISSHTFICEGVTIEDHVFIGHGVTFINDSYPRATTADGTLQTADDWTVESTLVKQGASIGSGATILANVVRVAVIGYGYWGPNVVRNLHALEHCEVAAICDRNPAVLRRASRAYPGMPTTSDFAEVLSSPLIDAVAIVTPVWTHFPLAK